MAPKLIIPVLLLFSVSQDITAQSPSSKDPPRFMGREIVITEPETDASGLFPKGPASICIQGPPQPQCYVAPNDFGRFPTVELVQVEKDMPALFFSAASGGVSGFAINFALLRPGDGKDLVDLFFPDTSASNQSQYAFWTDPAISGAQIFITADAIWGPEQAHFGEHRFIISAYVFADGLYYLEDRYMTVHKYDVDANADILGSEKQEILARLRRVKAETELRQQTPR